MKYLMSTVAWTCLAIVAAPAVARAAEATVTDASAVEEVIVTATKRETNLQETPIAITVASGESLKDRHVQSLIDLAEGSIPALRRNTTPTGCRYLRTSSSRERSVTVSPGCHAG